MSKEMTIITLGVWVIVVPYLGVPSSWRTTIFLFTGILIVVVGFLLRGESLSRGNKRVEHEPFVENNSIPPTLDPQNPRHDRKERINSLN